jgi:hypothetical protein
MKLIQGVEAHRAKTAKQKDIKLRELSRSYTHFVVHKNKGGSWGVYACSEPGLLMWHGIYSHLKMPNDAIYLQRTEFGFYGFAIRDGLLENEWVNSEVIDFQTAQSYINSQAHEASQRFAIYLCGFDGHSDDPGRDHEHVES